jgi:hypothetical protein
MLVPGMAAPGVTARTLSLGEFTRSGQLLSDLYELLIRPNYKFPMKEIFPAENRTHITQKDFAVLLRQVEKEWRPQQAQANPALRPLAPGNGRL